MSCIRGVFRSAPRSMRSRVAVEVVKGKCEPIFSRLSCKARASSAFSVEAFLTSIVGYWPSSNHRLASSSPEVEFIFNAKFCETNKPNSILILFYVIILLFFHSFVCKVDFKFTIRGIQYLFHFPQECPRDTYINATRFTLEATI